MKKVFSSNSEVCHIWAQQTQEEGRAGSVYFEGDTIFSYGPHYAMARIHTVKGKRFALVNSRRSSVTTEGKHKSAVRDALSGLMSYYPSPDVSNVKAAVAHLDSLAQQSIEQAMKRIKVTGKPGVVYELQKISGAFEKANDLRGTLGLTKKFIKPAQLNAVKAHLAKRLARWNELNTPEMLAERAKEAARRQQIENEKQIQLDVENIEKFRAGQPVSVYHLPFELLRVQGDEVVTSRGARVPLAAAVALYRAVDSGRDVKGITIGSFTVIGVTDTGTDKIVQIGCHKILLSEAARLLAVQQVA